MNDLEEQYEVRYMTLLVFSYDAYTIFQPQLCNF